MLAVTEGHRRDLQARPVRQHHDRRPARSTSPRAVLAQLTRNCAPTSSSAAGRRWPKLEALKAGTAGLITKVQGTGLLFSMQARAGFKGYGAGSTEEWLRRTQAWSVIHGGENLAALHPHFAIGAEDRPAGVAW